jgi:hypothetical protein
VQLLPETASVVQALLSLQSAAEPGQWPGWPAAMALSQVSPVSTTPLPHTAALQLGSCPDPQPDGQQPSFGPHVVIVVCEQLTLQVVAEPEMVSVVQLLLSLHEVGQLDGGSQVSPRSTTPLPQTG